jgi:hypothetical protein
MTEKLGYGLSGSLNARVDHEIKDLRRDNPALRRARYSVLRRLLQAVIVNRSIGQILGVYLVVALVALVCEWAAYRYASPLLPGYHGAAVRDFLKDVGSYLITAQIGVLAIVSVAVGVVTLLSDRGDGSSVNTDVRLYYVDSYSYELTVSGVGLLLVVTLQLFWPFQHILHSAGFGGTDYAFKLVLTALHVLWFCLNLLLFLQFITTTLRFVEPSSREGLRERYSANEIIPRDAKTRLLRALFLNAPNQIFGEQALREGPGITFGYRSSIDDRAVAEAAKTFRSPVRLWDVRLRPLILVLRRWQRRVREGEQRRGPFGQPLWSDRLTIPLGFDDIFEGATELAIRHGQVPLDRIERWIVRRCFRFRPVSTRDDDLPTPNNFLEQLVDKLVRQVDQNATTGFRAALDETIRFHRFILAAQNTKDTAGNPLNLAEIGGWMSRPDADLVHQYRRAFGAAADKIGSDTFYIDRMSNLVPRLIPDDALNFSQRVLQTLLELGLHQIWAMEDWLTRRAVIGTATLLGESTGLAGSDKRAHENALIGFVSGWENLAQTLISAFSLKRPSAADDPDVQWCAFAQSLPIFQSHLFNAAYFFASALWNDDTLGADRLRDMLLRWLNPFYSNLQKTYAFSNTVLLTPDLLSQPWPTARTEVTQRMRFYQEAALPGPIFGILLWELHCDVICVSGLISLHWYATGEQPSETASQAALLTLRRVKRAGDGSDLTNITQKSVFRLLFDFAVRYALNPRFAEGRYSATIDSLVRFLTNLSSPRMVSGRIYSGFGIDGLETLRPVLLAALAANFPTQGDDGIGALTEALKADPFFADDKRVRDFIWTMQQMHQALGQVEVEDLYGKAARLFNSQIDLAVATERLKDVLAGVVTTFVALRKTRLLAAPLDEDRVGLVRRRMSDAAMVHGPTITCFRDYIIQRDTTGAIPIGETEFGVIDKGLFTLPQLSAATFDDLPGVFVEVLRAHLSNHIWRDFYARPKRVIQISIADETDAFWRRAIAEAPTVGPDPILLVPYANLGDQIALATLGNAPAGMTVTREQQMPSGGGTGYLGSLDGIPVYSSQIFVDRAVLCSSRLLRAISYGVVHGTQDVADFEFIPNEEPEKSRIRLRFAQRSEWRDDVFVEFDLRESEQA